MFELKYKLNDADVKAVNKRMMWTYFLPYMIVSLLGIAAGIAATVLRPRVEILVLGIILLVLAAVLCCCSVLLLIAPKNFVASALMTSDEVEREVTVDDNGVTVKTPDQSDIKLSFSEIYAVKNKKTYLLLYVGKDSVIIVKDAITSGQSLEQLFGFIKGKLDAVKTASDRGVGDTVSASAEKPDEDASQNEQGEESDKPAVGTDDASAPAEESVADETSESEAK